MSNKASLILIFYLVGRRLEEQTDLRTFTARESFRNLVSQGLRFLLLSCRQFSQSENRRQKSTRNMTTMMMTSSRHALTVLLMLAFSASVLAFSPSVSRISSPGQSTLHQQDTRQWGDDAIGIESPARRHLFEAAAAASLLINAQIANSAETASTTRYEDQACKFSIDLPAGWTESVQTLPDRRKIVLYIKPDSDQKTLIFLAYTPVRDDYTSLGSFGSVDEVAEATILPKGAVAGKEGVESKMLSADAKKQSYMFDYVSTVPPQPTTHFRTIFTLKQAVTGGYGNVLVTITAQAPESDYSSVKPLFDKIVESYQA